MTMPLGSLRETLTAQLSTYDWKGAADTCARVVESIRGSKAPADLETASGILYDLRRKRRFDLMVRVASAVRMSGTVSPFIRRQHAQALIDQGDLVAARSLLDETLADGRTSEKERAEAHGLIGRIHKQEYVNVEKVRGEGRPEDLELALGAYRTVFDTDHATYLWHGINVVALLARTGEKGIAASREIASEILALLKARKPLPDSGDAAWDEAIRLEACVALGDGEEATTSALKYAHHPWVDVFELESTRRQLEEVWRLGETALGDSILPVVRGALLRGQGSRLTLQSGALQGDVDRGLQLEKVFGDEKTRTISWYRGGLSRCAGIARIEKAGRGIGTGWLVRGRDFFPAWNGGLLLLTNAHVVASPDVQASTTDYRLLGKDDVRVNFQECKAQTGVRRVVWCSPLRALDASLLELDDVPGTALPIPLSPRPVRMPASPTPPTRLYVIGHPGGRDLEFSLYDNDLVAVGVDRLHYRTPTEEGSSGSPVFEQDEWQAVALHHAGKARMPSMLEPGETYEANEGIVVQAIRDATAASGVTPGP